MRIIFYDADCPLCQNAVLKIIQRDPKRLFHFASFESQTAKRLLKESRGESLILWDEGRELKESRAFFRILWHLGGVYAPLGLLSFLPSWPFDWIYRQVAKRRDRFCPRKREFAPDSERFLK